MRLVQASIPTDKREAVLSTLDEEEVDYVVTDETGDLGHEALVTFPLPTEAVEPVLEQLREVGLDHDAYTVVLEAETVVSRRFEALEERYSRDEEVDSDRIAREELQARAADLVTGTRAFVVMTVLSAVIATAGLLLDSPAVVVGSMVIAPLIGPAMAASVGTVLDDADLFVRGVKFQVAGLVLAVASAAAFAFVLKTTLLVPPGIDVTAIPQVRERLTPDVLSLAVALGAGVAGVVSLSTGVSSALVGVMIAVALIPPAATVGIGVAWGLPLVSVSSGVLLLVNVLSINLAALIVLWWWGYRPTDLFRFEEVRGATLKRGAVLACGILVLSVFLGGVTYDSFRDASQEQRIREEVESAMADYEAAELVSVTVEESGEVAFASPDRVVVVVGVSPDGAPPGLADELDDRIERVAGHDIGLQVRYVTIEQR